MTHFFQLLSSLHNILARQLSEHEELSSILKEEKKAIDDYQFKAIEEQVIKKDILVQTLVKVEKERLNILSKLAPHLSIAGSIQNISIENLFILLDKKLIELSNTISKEEQIISQDLYALKKQYSRRMFEITQEAKLNRKILQKLLQHVSSSLSFLSSLAGTGKGYDAKGTSQDSIRSSFLDIKA